jgi:cation transporter-like permease
MASLYHYSGHIHDIAWLTKINMDPNYFRGVAVGLTIAWVTTGIAYYVVYYVRHNPSPTLLPKLIVLELVVSIVMFIVAFLISSHFI